MSDMGSLPFENCFGGFRGHTLLKIASSRTAQLRLNLDSELLESKKGGVV